MLGMMNWKMKIIYLYWQLWYLNSVLAGYMNARLAKKEVKAELGIINNDTTKVILIM